MGNAGTPPKLPQQVQLKPLWKSLDAHPAMAANMFLLQQTGQEFILTAGFGALPFLSKPEDLAGVKSVEPQVIARLVLTPGRVVELLGMLQTALAQYQAMQKQ